MKIGLLICDEVRPEYRAEFGTYPEMFARLFPEYEMKLYPVFKGEFPKSVNECSIYMATGSSHSCYENLDWIKKVKEFIKEIYSANKYFIGFCFGHQLMAEALGGKVEKVAIGWCVGIHQFEVNRIKHWMRPAKSKVSFLMMCQDQVVKLPKDAVRLAGSIDCPNAIIQIGERMMSVQGHPEFSKEYDTILMQSRVARIGKEKVAKGIASLALPADVSLFKSWVKSFLK